MCIEYQFHPRASALFYVTSVVLPPIVFIVGLAGNVLLLVILSRKSVRRETAVYVYYTAVAGVDLVALLCAVPTFVRDLDFLPPSVAYSRPMAYVVWTHRAVEPMLRHTAGWLTAMAAGVRCVSVRLGSTASGSSAHSATIGVSRIVAFIIFVACVLLDFTRFLDAAVRELTDHCLAGDVRLWSAHNVTALGRRRFYVELQPAVSTLAGEVLPMALLLLFALVLFVGRLRCCRRTPPVALRTPVDDDERHYQLSVSVFLVSLALVLLDSPSAALALTRVFYFRSGTDVTYSSLWLIARCLSLVRCAVNCVILVVVKHDVRKTARRTFCCCCSSDDDVYFEPVRCCPAVPLSCCPGPRHYQRPKARSWHQLDYVATTTDVIRISGESLTHSGSQLHRMALLHADQRQNFGGSLWV